MNFIMGKVGNEVNALEARSHELLGRIMAIEKTVETEGSNDVLEDELVRLTEDFDEANERASYLNSLMAIHEKQKKLNP